MVMVSRIAGLMTGLMALGCLGLSGVGLMEISSYGGTYVDPGSVFVVLIGLFFTAFCALLSYILWHWTTWVRKNTNTQLKAFD